MTAKKKKSKKVVKTTALARVDEDPPQQQHALARIDPDPPQGTREWFEIQRWLVLLGVQSSDKDLTRLIEYGMPATLLPMLAQRWYVTRATQEQVVLDGSARTGSKTSLTPMGVSVYRVDVALYVYETMGLYDVERDMLLVAPDKLPVLSVDDFEDGVSVVEERKRAAREKEDADTQETRDRKSVV